MMKTPGTPSYLQKIARRPPNSLPLLKPPHVPMRRLEMTPPHDVVGETTLTAHHPSAMATDLDITEPSLQTPTQPMAERQPAFSIEKAPEVEVVLEAKSPSAARTSRMRTPSVPSNISTEIEHGKNTTPPAGSQKSSPEIQLAPVRSIESTGSVASKTDQPSLAAQNNVRGPGKVSREERPTSVTLHPSSQQEQTTTITSTRSRRSDDITHQEHDASTKTPSRSAQITLVPRAPERQAASLSQKKKPETQQQTSIRIGTIEIQIVPPPAPPMPLPTPHPTLARPRSTSALSRELTSFIGLRQG